MPSTAPRTRCTRRRLGLRCLIGVKEVNIEDLVPGKTYSFSAHKLQPYNAKLLAAILDKKIRLIDYELLKRPGIRRIIGFGRWAGSRSYGGLRAYGLRSGSFELPKAIDCRDLEEMLAHVKVSPFPRTSRLSSQAW